MPESASPETFDDLQSGGLSGAVRTEDPEELTLFDGERDAVDGVYLAVVFTQIVDDDRGPHGAKTTQG